MSSLGADGVLLADIADAALEVARAGAQADSTEALAADIARLGAGLLHADRASVGLLRDGFVETVASFTVPRRPVRTRLPLGFGLAGWSAATHEAAEVADVHTDPRFAFLPADEVRSLLTLPLTLGNDELLGVLSIAAYHTHAFPPGSSQLLAPFAAHAALALRQTQRQAELQTKLAHYEQDARAGLADTLHHLKNPLHNLGGFLTLLASDESRNLTARQREIVDTAQMEWRRLKQDLAGVLQAVLDGEQALRLEPLQPAAVLRDAATRATGQALARRVRLETYADQHLPPVAGDAAALRHVVGNLLDNALRHAPRGSCVRLSAEPDGTCVAFAVHDDGPGVPAGTERVFERGQSAAGRTSPTDALDVGGTGLGLWLCRQLLMAQHGTIQLEPTRGGARFVFRLPLWQAQPAEAH